MRIVVPMKQVPETNAVRMDEATGTMIREGVEAIVNPLDLYAIELAIRLRDRHGGRVSVVSMGPPGAMRALREAIAMGCDSAVLLSNKSFAGSDTWATSHVLAAALTRLDGFDLVICGERATDGDTGQVGPGLAAFLDLPVATYVSAVEEISSSEVRVRRVVEDGYEVLLLKLPAVLTVVKEIGEPRLPTLAGKRRARKIDIPTWSPLDIGVESEKVGLTGSPTRVVKIFRPKIARAGRKLVAGDEVRLRQAVDELVAFLKDRQLL